MLVYKKCHTTALWATFQMTTCPKIILCARLFLIQTQMFVKPTNKHVHTNNFIQMTRNQENVLWPTCSAYVILSFNILMV